MLYAPYLWDSGVPDEPLPPAAPLSTGVPLTGGLQLDVDPRRALVYVDGWFAGVVEDFSGYYRHLDLAAGPHRIDLVAPDCDPLFTFVVVSPGRTTTYRGQLNHR